MSDTISKTLKLTRPIKGSSGPITELVIKEPTLGMLRKHGLPAGKDGQIDFDKAAKLLEAATLVQMPFLDQMSPRDSMAAIQILAEFFGGDGATDETVKN